MSKRTLSCIILAAGKGTRMKSDKPKVMHEIAGRPMISWLIDTCEQINPDEIIIVSAPDMPEMQDVIAPHKIAIQTEQQGTGDAVRAALPVMDNKNGDVLILLGDAPLLSVYTLKKLVDTRHDDDNVGISVLGVDLEDPTGYGRLVVDEDDVVGAIVEDRDCDDNQRDITLCNTGAFCVDAAKIREWTDGLATDNAQMEYYITDIPAIALKEGIQTKTYITHDPEEVFGANTRADLARLEKIAQSELRRNAMLAGATLLDPDSVYFSWDTKIGQDVIIEPHVFFGPKVKIASNVQIKAFSHIEDAEIASGAVIGPFARLRPGADIREDVKIGNFVEVKKATLHKGAKANHFGYIGDAEIGAGTNFSCGAITANYDGYEKHKTIIGENVMVGSNVNLIAPVTIGDGAFLAAGSTISDDVPADALAKERSTQEHHEGWAAKNRESKLAAKAQNIKKQA